MSFAAAQVLGEVSPHGCGLPWPETIERVAEWCGRDAGRRSAGLGSEGAAQGQSHAVGVRGREIERFPNVSRSGVTDRVICSGGEHVLFNEAKPTLFVNTGAFLIV